MERMFSNYPDVVSISDFMQMLNIGKNTAYSLLQNGTVKSIKIGKQYRIPKQFIIDYLIQQEYPEYSPRYAEPQQEASSYLSVKFISLLILLLSL